MNKKDRGIEVKRSMVLALFYVVAIRLRRDSYHDGN